MVTAIVQFKLAVAISCQKAAELFAGTAPKYQQVPGLICNYYLLSEDGWTAGGVYLWHSRGDFETPMIVDNLSRQIITS